MCGTMHFENVSKEYADANPERKPTSESKMKGCIATCGNVDGCNSANFSANNSFVVVVMTLLIISPIRQKIFWNAVNVA